MNAQDFAKDLLAFIDQSPSPWHAAATTCQHLAKAGFQQLSEDAPWDLQLGAGYYVVRDDSSVIAFRLGSATPAMSGFRIIGAHTDSPGLRLKPCPTKHNQEWCTLGVEVYGGPILATFTDRDLSLAGRVAYRNADHISSALIKFDEPLVRIPNLAIHLNRSVNEDGLKLNPQTEMPLILSLANDGDREPVKRLVAERLDIDPEAILAWEFAVYDTQPGTLWGPNDEFLANSQLDNLAMCHAALEALIDADSSNATQVIALFDHEEVGSGSDKGADGNFLRDVLNRIVSTLDSSTQAPHQAIAKSVMLSADMAHAWHPNYPDKHDSEHRPIINQGPVIKINHNQRYTTDAMTEALFVALCEDNKIPYQKFVNRTDLSCGSTIGPMTAASLGVPSLDVGSPQWAMHSIRECAGVHDHLWMKQAMTAFLNSL